MKKFEIINNSLVVTDTVTNKILFDNPKSDIYYNSGFLFLNPSEIRIVDFNSKYIYNCFLSEAVNSLSVAFTQETFIDFARRNLGFKTASGGSGAIVYLSENYSALILEETAYLNAGDLAYIYNSQGTSWLPGSIGGNYYPSGFYVWNGTNWDSDRNAIATQFNTNILDILDLQNNKQDNLVSGTNIKTLEGQSILGSGNIDLTKSDVGLSNVQNTDTTTTANITDSINKRFVTDTQITNINNQSGTNTGDETTLSIQTKRPLKTIENQSLEGSGNIDLEKSDVGLANVDNTSDANKPISTATQTALDLKQNTLVSGTNIKTINSSSLLGAGNLVVGTVTSVSALTIGTSGTNINSTIATGTTTPVITLNVPDASASARGVITTGTQTIAGAKTFTGNFVVSATSATIGNSASASTINIGTGANGTGVIKTIDIGTNGASGSTTNITFGSAVLGSNNNLFFNGNLLIQAAQSGERQISVGRMSATLLSGQLRVFAGGALPLSTNANGGALVLSGGVSTGNGTSSVQIVTYGGGASGTADSSPQTRMLIDGNGNVGIGTTSPLYKLDVVGEIASSSPSANSYRLIFGSYASFLRNDGSDFYIMQTANGDTNGSYNNNRPFSFNFSTGNVNIANSAITANRTSGNVGIGTTSPSSKLEVVTGAGFLRLTTNDGNGSDGGYGLSFNISNTPHEIAQIVGRYETSAGGGSGGLRFKTRSSGTLQTVMAIESGGNVGIGTTSPSEKLHVIGNIVATGTITPSDKRLKSNIKNIDNISEKFNKLRPVSYNKKHGLNSKNSIFEYGFIADEFMELFPELVTEYGEDKIKAINYTSIIALLIKEVQTLKTNNYVSN